MNRILLAAGAALLMMAGVAVAQTTSPPAATRTALELADAAQSMEPTAASPTTMPGTPGATTTDIVTVAIVH